MENRVEILRKYIDGIFLKMADSDNRRCAYLHLYGVSQACALLAREVLGKLKITSPKETDMICSAIHNHSSKGGQFSAFDVFLCPVVVYPKNKLENIAKIIKNHEKEPSVVYSSVEDMFNDLGISLDDYDVQH